MSAYVFGWVLKHSPVQSPADLLVLLVLADCAHDDGGGAFPSVATIAERARCSERTAQYALRRLEAGGHIRPIGKTARGTVVYLVETGGARSAPPQNLHPGVQRAAPESPLKNHQESSTDGSSDGSGADDDVTADLRAALRDVDDSMAATTAASYLADVTATRTADGAVVVVVPSANARQSEPCRDLLRSAAHDVAGFPVDVEITAPPPAGETAPSTGADTKETP